MWTLELKWWLQGFGSNVEVLEPISVRDEFIAMSNSLSSIYTKSYKPF